MAHISSIGAGIYSHLSVTREDVSVSGSEALTAFGTLSETDLGAAFTEEVALGTAVATTAGSFTRISNVREFPSMGTPPNIVNVPVYGQSTSQQIQGQSDAPTMELTINYVGTDWQDTADYFGDMVGDDGGHEGIVIRNPKIDPNPIKITGDFIETGMFGAIAQVMAQNENTITMKEKDLLHLIESLIAGIF